MMNEKAAIRLVNSLMSFTLRQLQSNSQDARNRAILFLSTPIVKHWCDVQEYNYQRVCARLMELANREPVENSP